MNGKSLHSRGAFSRSNRISLDVVLAYEDFLAGLHVLHVFDRLFTDGDLEKLSGEKSIWKFDLLGIGSLAKTAAAEAAGADMVVISAHGRGHLPPAVKFWVQTWTARWKKGPGAMVLLLDGVGTDSSRPLPTEDYLKEQAERAGMDFFVHKTGGFHALHDFDMEPGPRSVCDPFEVLRQVMQAAGNRLQFAPPRGGASRQPSKTLQPRPPMNEVMIGENTVKIIADISQFINARGGDCSEWHIGVAADAERELFEKRRLPRDHSWIFRRAMSAQEARAIVQGFMNLSCNGNLNGGRADDQSAVQVFVYRKPDEPGLANRATARYSDSRPLVDPA